MTKGIVSNIKMSNNSKQQHAFTLLEVIIVIIIVGVLASLALPRFFRLIEYSRSTEALVNIAAIRQSLERCYIMNGGVYNGNYQQQCGGGFTSFDFQPWKLDIDYPGYAPNAHFDYSVGWLVTGFTIIAVRNTRDGNIDAGFPKNCIGLSILFNGAAGYCASGSFKQFAGNGCFACEGS